MWSELQRRVKSSKGRRGLLLEALAALAIARVAMALLPFRRIASWLGTPGAESPSEVTAQEIRIAKDVGWAVSVLGPRVPWDGRCLAQALAATGMLRRRKQEGTLSFGVCEGESAGLEAHAWLRLGSCIITGGAGLERFKICTTFARTKPLAE
jgi:hypothetical protein